MRRHFFPFNSTLLCFFSSLVLLYRLFLLIDTGTLEEDFLLKIGVKQSVISTQRKREVYMIFTLSPSCSVSAIWNN